MIQVVSWFPVVEYFIAVLDRRIDGSNDMRDEEGKEGEVQVDSGNGRSLFGATQEVSNDTKRGLMAFTHTLDRSRAALATLSEPD